MGDTLSYFLLGRRRKVEKKRNTQNPAVIRIDLEIRKIRIDLKIKKIETDLEIKRRLHLKKRKVVIYTVALVKVCVVQVETGLAYI